MSDIAQESIADDTVLEEGGVIVEAEPERAHAAQTDEAETAVEQSEILETDGDAIAAEPVKVQAIPLPEEILNGSEKERKRRKIPWWLIGLLAVGLAGVAAAWAYLESQVPTIEVAVVEKGDLEIALSGSGVITPDDPIDVYSKNQGIVSKVFVTDGQKVSKDAPLLELDRAPLQAQLLAAESGLAQARNGLTLAQSGANSRQNAIEAAQRGVDAAYFGLNTARELEYLAQIAVIDAQYFLDLVRSQAVVNPIDVAQAEAALNQARVGHQQAVAGVAQAEGSVAAANGALAQAQAGDPRGAIEAANKAITAAEEQVKLAKEALDDAMIKAPVAGIVLFAPTPAAAQSQAAGAGTPVSGATISAGSAVTPGMVLFTITNPEHILFEAEINEADIARLSLEQSATVTLDGYADTQFEGTVTKIAKSARKTITGGTVFPVEITIRAPKENIAIGMKGDATITISTRQGVTSVPYQALFTEGGNTFVYLVRDDRLVKTAVEVGESSDTVVEIIRGVSVGDQVALAGNTPFVDAMRVR